MDTNLFFQEPTVALLQPSYFVYTSTRVLIPITFRLLECDGLVLIMAPTTEDEGTDQPTTQPCPFFDLLRELRDLVYEYLTVEAGKHIAHQMA